MPAIIKNKKNKIFVKKNYFKFFNKRPDLKKYIKKVTFVKEHNFKKKDVVIFAKRPSDQYKFLKRYSSKFLYFFLEKPLAANHKISKELILFLIKTKVKFSIAYLFLYTRWYANLAKITKNTNIDTIFLVWNFKSKNSSKSWKNIPKHGGGLINFYGTHILALMSSLKFTKCKMSLIKKKNNKQVFWNSEFKNKKNIKFNIKINIESSLENFDISYILKNDNKVIKQYKDQDPFGKKNNKFLDHRVKILKKYLSEDKNFVRRKSIYLNVIKLWEKVDMITKSLKI